MELHLISPRASGARTRTASMGARALNGSLTALRNGFAMLALAGVGLLAASHAHAQTRATPFDAWPQPQIRKTLSVDEA
jgi:hypothetical protein